MKHQYKLIALSAVVIFFSAMPAHATLTLGLICGTDQNVYYGNTDGNDYCGTAAGSLACAPEVVHGNVVAADRVLQGLANNQLRDATQFTAIVASDKKLDEQHRLAAYLNLVDVTDDKEIAEFMGERTINPKYINALSQNAGLTREQSALVINQLTKALLGSEK